MPSLTNLPDIWKNVKELDLRPLRQQAETSFKIALVGAPGTGRNILADKLRRDPAQPQAFVDSPLAIYDLPDHAAAAEADLILLLLGDAETSPVAAEAARAWAAADRPVVVIATPAAPALPTSGVSPWTNWGRRRVVRGRVEDDRFLSERFSPTVLALFSDRLLPLARQFPLFRLPVAHQLINDSSFANAAYSLSTGLAEIVPVLDIPLNMTDMVVLTKNQAFLVYKLGLALGMSTEWQDYVTEFGSVLGGGFLWRQLARSLIGLIPAWGIAPKMAVAYAGTFVVGNVILQWYLTGRHITPQQMRALYGQAFGRGKALAQNLIARVPRPRLPRLGRRKKVAALPATLAPTCPQCGRQNAADAAFCAYCATPLAPEILLDPGEAPGTSAENI